MSLPLEQIEKDIMAAAGRVLRRLEAERDRLNIEAPGAGTTYWSNLHTSDTARTLAAPPAEPRALKYLYAVKGHVEKWRMYLPYLTDLKRIYEIGVGPGYLVRLLRDGFEIDITGCDTPEKASIYYELCRELGIEGRVQDYRVVARQDIPIPEGSDSVVSFCTVFNSGWSVEDHAWFLDFCRERLVGPKRIVMLFNAFVLDDVPSVRAFYEAKGDFPLLGSDKVQQKYFCIMHL